jgi:predicted metal-dependent hydrolase
MNSMLKIDRLIRSKRKTLSLEILADGSLQVRAPQHLSRAQIEAAVAQKEAWVRAKQETARRLPRAPVQPGIQAGDTFYYLGQPYCLTVVEQQAAPLIVDGRFSLRRSDLGQAAELLRRWYMHQAQALILPRVVRLAAQHSLSYRRASITRANTRWGSCGAHGSLNFSYRLVMTPPAVIDYVIVHELAHLQVRNHSRAFWQVVQSLLPGYRDQVAWLKQNSASLARLD